MNMQIRPMSHAEMKYAFTQSNQIMGQTGCIGHLRADMDTNGTGFFSGWEDHRSYLKTDEFKEDFDQVINALRFDSAVGHPLKDRSFLGAYCSRHPRAAMPDNLATGSYGFRADTENYSYMLRLNPRNGEYNSEFYDVGETV